MRALQIACVILGMAMGGTLLAQSTNPAQNMERTPTADRAQDNTDTTTPRAAMSVPEGTEIVVRTNDAIDSTTATESQSFSGTVQETVTSADGQTLIPKGSDVRLMVRKATSGGTTGSPQLTLGLESINIRGHRYQVDSTDIQQGSNSGIGKNRRTAEYIGGGAALGTLLGAIAGGGKGAAIGAVAGAAAGGTAQVLTKGKEVKVPAETTLRFRLDQPLSLRATD